MTLDDLDFLPQGTPGLNIQAFDWPSTVVGSLSMISSITKHRTIRTNFSVKPTIGCCPITRQRWSQVSP